MSARGIVCLALLAAAGCGTASEPEPRGDAGPIPCGTSTLCPPGLYCLDITLEGGGRCVDDCMGAPCREGPPAGSEVSECAIMPHPNGCASDSSYCCAAAGRFFCVDRVLGGYSCM
jgi:hypothetical protein